MKTIEHIKAKEYAEQYVSEEEEPSVYNLVYNAYVQGWFDGQIEEMKK